MSPAMPSPDGKLTLEEKKKIADHVKELWGDVDRRCPICGSTDWLLADHIVQPLTLDQNRRIAFGGDGYPFVMLISETCGYTMFLNAVIVGLDPPRQTGDSQEKP